MRQNYEMLGDALGTAEGEAALGERLAAALGNYPADSAENSPNRRAEPPDASTTANGRENASAQEARGPAGTTSLLHDVRCPISLEVMRDPVIADDGHSYERESIERWLQCHRTSPLTGRVLLSRHLIPNHRLRAVIDELASAAGSGV